jgi:predicted kinase
MEKKAIILLGLPLAGKTTWIKEDFNVYTFSKYVYISADVFKEEHPNYDPNDSEALHEWSVSKAERFLKSTANAGDSLILDSGSINNRYTFRIINYLKSHDYYIELVHIKTPYTVCLERNKKRERKIPEKAITDKALKEVSQFYKLEQMVDKVTVVDYFKNYHIFVDMDGVIAAQSTLPIINNEIDFVNGEIHKWQKPVKPVIDILHNLKIAGYNIYILSATPNSFSTDEKNKWLDKYFNVIPEHRFFVNQGRHKAEMLDNLVRKFKLDKSEVLLVDDIHETLYNVKARGMNAMHVSEFLTHNFTK